MVFILKEKEARKVFKGYKNVVAFTLGNSEGISENGLEISYAKLNFLPDQDTINAVVNGDVSAKKVIKKAVKAIRTPSVDNYVLDVNMAQLVNLIAPDKNNVPKKGPNILVFVMDEAEDKAADKANKFLTRYLTALFMEFGLEPITDSKVVKKLFKGKKKKNVKKVVDFMRANGQVRVSGKGYALKKYLFAFFSLELQQSGLMNTDINDYSKKEIASLATGLLKVYTNDNLEALTGFSVGKKMKKKDQRKAEIKIMKALKSKNKDAVESYKVLVEIMKQLNPETAAKMPKVKNGYTKKGKKKGTDKPKMNTKKFMKFFTKKSNVGLMALIYAHTTYTLMGLEVGTSSYNKKMAEVGSQVGEDGFSKAFTAAAKAYAKAQNVTVG